MLILLIRRNLFLFPHISPVKKVRGKIYEHWIFGTVCAVESRFNSQLCIILSEELHLHLPLLNISQKTKTVPGHERSIAFRYGQCVPYALAISKNAYNGTFIHKIWFYILYIIPYLCMVWQYIVMKTWIFNYILSDFWSYIMTMYSVCEKIISHEHVSCEQRYTYISKNSELTNILCVKIQI